MPELRHRCVSVHQVNISLLRIIYMQKESSSLFLKMVTQTDFVNKKC